MISDEEHDRLKTALVELRLRLSELDDGIDDENDDARTSLLDTWRQFNALARIIAPVDDRRR